jgi:N-acetylneuraminate synthase/N,N'-diacetyllegionaminate synthase
VSITIGNRQIGSPNPVPVFVIAEAGVNHNGQLDLALRLVDAAKSAGADAVKFQLFRVAEQISANAPTADYQRGHTGNSSMLEMAKNYDLPWEAHRAIFSHCRSVGIEYMASCFDSSAVDFLLDLGGDAVKVGSGEITNFPLIEHIARSGKPLLLSTGMSTLDDVRRAVDHFRLCGGRDLALFQCVSNYPSQPEDLNLRAMATLAKEFGVPVGFSDHSVGNTAAVAAVALGACLLEKHFTLDKAFPGPDHSMSLDPGELAAYIKEVRIAECCLGSGEKKLAAGESEVQSVARRSLVAARRIMAGEALNEGNVAFKRPGTGIDPRDWPKVCGRRSQLEIPADTLITWDMLS